MPFAPFIKKVQVFVLDPQIFPIYKSENPKQNKAKFI
jgi:hypothetical protein